MKFFYGVEFHYVDVTKKVETQCVQNGILTLPATDMQRAAIFNDHLVGILKHVKFIRNSNSNNNNSNISKIVISGELLQFKLEKDDFFEIDNSIESYKYATVREWYHAEGKIIEGKDKRLNAIHDRLIIFHGNKKDEYPEQMMAMEFIKANDIVLELGSNIGRNTCVIATILKDDKNLVTLETMENTAKQLKENKDINHFEFHIENSGLSKKPLHQSGWNSIVSEEKIDGFVQVKTITWEELLKKYTLNFTTLVADCEGALYYILKEEPDMLKNFETIIVENDYNSLDHYQFVDSLIKKNGFVSVYSCAGGFGPCIPFFYQVYKK